MTVPCGMARGIERRRFVSGAGKAVSMAAPEMHKLHARVHVASQVGPSASPVFRDMQFTKPVSCRS